jgi:hypothetical protein
MAEQSGEGGQEVQEQPEPVAPGFEIIKITFPAPLAQRAWSAAYAEGFGDFSKFVCRAVREWVNEHEAKRPDECYPVAPIKRPRSTKT